MAGLALLEAGLRRSRLCYSVTTKYIYIYTLRCSPYSPSPSSIFNHIPPPSVDMPVPVPVPSILPPDMRGDAQDTGDPFTGPSTTALALPAPSIPTDASMNLLNSLLVFYQHERGWVQRTRASLELAYVQGPILAVPAIGAPTDSQSDSDGSAPSATSSEDSSDEPTPTTSESESEGQGGRGTYRDESMSDAEVKQEEQDDALVMRPKMPGPLTLRATAAARAHASRWSKRKQSFKLHLGTLSAHSPTRPRMHADGPEPSAQLLGLFGDLLDARMESCLRITRLVRDSNRSMLHTW